MKRIIQTFGRLAIFASGLFAFPLLISLLYGDGTHWDFAISMVLTAFIGLTLWYLTRHEQRELKNRDGFVLVTLMWTGFAAIATMPLQLYDPHLSFTDAYFETVSGLTTTGATTFVGLDNFPPAINFWRHFLQWIGGMGIIVLAVAVLPMLGVGGMQLMKAEIPGPIKEEKLTPRIRDTAKSLYLVYAGLTLICCVILKLAGMSWLDAICHAFATLSLGGFSTHDSSLMYFNSPAIEGVILVFMLVAALNFPTHYAALTRRSFRPYARDPESRAFLLLMLVLTLVLSIYLYLHGDAGNNPVYASYWESLRYVTFNLVSIATSTGFVSANYDPSAVPAAWPMFVPLCFLFASTIASNSSSTGGGIKMVRMLIILKQGLREIRHLLHPHAIFPLKLGGTVVPNRVVFSVVAFVFFYFFSIIVLTLLLVASNMEFITAYTAIVATINNVGPGLGEHIVGPATNFGGLSNFQTWVCTFSMILGRLECFTVFVVFAQIFWRW